MFYLGVDIGGTKTAVGIIDKENRLLEVESIPTDVEGGLAKIGKNTADLINKVMDNQNISYSDLKYIGVGCPGTVDSREGIVRYANNLKFLDAPLGEELSKYIPIPIILDNDANCAGLGEYYMLEDKEIKDFLMITLGTGVGSASVIGGKLFKGFNNAAPELGHCIIKADGILCECGNRGCWEMYCAGHSLVRKAKEVAINNRNSLMWHIAKGDIEAIDGRVPFMAAEEGDEAARQVVDYYLHYLKIGIANGINAFQPEILAIGGGISEQGEIIIKTAQEAVNEGSYSKTIRLPKVIQARLGNKAGIYGAAFLGK